jgi:hypothetical protein
MEVWRSQDAAPLHGVNETLLRLALRQDEARLRTLRRREAWIIYVFSAGLTAVLVLFFMMMFGNLFANGAGVITGWDFVVPAVGAVASLLMGVALYVARRAQALREQRFGESLRDQVGRRITQLDYAMTVGRRFGTPALLAMYVSTVAFIVANARVNMEPGEPFTAWPGIGRVTIWFALVWLLGRWVARREVQRVLLPRKHRLETLLKELDTP